MGRSARCRAAASRRPDTRLIESPHCPRGPLDYRSKLIVYGGSARTAPDPARPGRIKTKLNGVTIPDFIVLRVVTRRGAEHCFAALDPKRTALVVIDLQHAFVNNAVGHAVVPAARDIVPAVNRLAATVRDTEGGVFWIKMTHDDRCLYNWSVAYELATPAMREKKSRRCPRHAWS
jgi:Isochorismatase family